MEASGDIRLLMDEGHSIHVCEGEKVFTAMSQEVDIIITLRQHPDSNMETHQSWLREHMGNGYIA